MPSLQCWLHWLRVMIPNALPPFGGVRDKYFHMAPAPLLGLEGWTFPHLRLGGKNVAACMEKQCLWCMHIILECYLRAKHACMAKLAGMQGSIPHAVQA
jgi:hypothetical protein